MNEVRKINSSAFINKIKWFTLAGIYFFLFHTSLAYILTTFSGINPFRVNHSSFYIEPLTLLTLFSVLLVFTRRVLGSMAMVSVGYILFMLANIEKIAALGAPLYPIDFLHAIELIRTWEVFSTYLPAIILAAIVLVLLVIFMKKEAKSQYFGKHINSIRAFTVGVIVLVILNHNMIAQSFVNAKVTKGQSFPLKGSEKNGFLFSFIYRVLKNDKPEPPNNYGFELVRNIFEKYNTPQPTKAVTKHPNLIIFFIEAFTDPELMGLETTFDPIPNFRSLSKEHSSGQIISPVIGGRSANAEFELLTGFSMRFVSNGSIPYIDLINSPKPSVVKEFRNNGYETSAIHVASLGYFNYQVAYPNLGFNHISTILHDPASKRDPAGRYPDETSLINKIITLTDNEPPQFIFAFPNSTHGLWNYPAYLNSDLNVKGDYFEEGGQEIKTYVNAIHSADKALKSLISHYQSSSEDTAILIMGDHQPSLPEYRQQFMIQNHLNEQKVDSLFKNRRAMINHFKSFIPQSDTKTLLMNHRVPYVVWTNFDSPIINQNLSMNLLGAKLLSLMNFNPSPLYKLLIKMHEEIEELSMLVKVDDDSYSHEVPQQYKEVVFDYQVLQYDVLYGNNYYSNLIGLHQQQ